MTLRSLTAVLAAAVGTGGLLAAFVVRNALWLTVQACVVDATLTGAPFPCLLVDMAAGELAACHINDMLRPLGFEAVTGRAACQHQWASGIERQVPGVPPIDVPP